MNRCQHQTRCLTERGYVGVFSRHVQVGDKVAIFLGCNAPFLLREDGESSDDLLYRVIGHCYVHGIMDGKALDEETMNRVEDICLIRIMLCWKKNTSLTSKAGDYGGNETVIEFPPPCDRRISPISTKLVGHGCYAAGQKNGVSTRLLTSPSGQVPLARKDPVPE